MINDNTILSSFNDRPTLLEWLKKVEEALKSDTATGVSVENPSVNSYIFKITFADGKTIASDTIRFPDSVKGASILNNHLILTMQSGLTDDLGVINPYAETIVLNSETNTTDIRNDTHVSGNFKVDGTITAGGNELTAVVANPADEPTGTLSKIKIGDTAYAVGGGSGDNFMLVKFRLTGTSGKTINNELTISDEVKEKLLNGEIKVISGTYQSTNGANIKFGANLTHTDSIAGGSIRLASFEGVSFISESYPLYKIASINILMQNTNANLQAEIKEMLAFEVPSMPTNAENSTFTFKLVNGNLTWVEG